MNFDSGIWIEHYSIKEGERRYAQHYCDGDTVINDTVYSKLYEYAISYFYPIYYPDTIQSYYIGAIRNNSNKQIEYVRTWQNSPEIIYDFNLNIGDTIKTGYGSDWDISVSDIDSVNICGTYHKRYIIFSNSSPGLSFTEGIGCTWGLIDPISYFESYSWLDCYTEMENNQCDYCELLLKVNDLKRNQSGIRLGSNPVRDEIQIIAEQGIDIVTIYTLTGSKIVQMNGQQRNSMIVPIDYSPGIYILSIQSDHVLYTHKIVVK
jgi:hypothetical protein